MENDQYIEAIAQGKGSLKYYNYYTSGLKLQTKKSIRDAILLKLKVIRKDKITNEIQSYDYKTKDFEVLK